MSQKDHTKAYLMVFGALLVLTVATVGVSYIHLSKGLGLFVGLLIATVKASLVASIFMHLKWEKPLIFAFLGLTVAAAVIMFVLPIIDSQWTMHTRMEQPVVMPQHAPAEPGAEPAH